MNDVRDVGVVFAVASVLRLGQHAGEDGQQVCARAVYNAAKQRRVRTAHVLQTNGVAVRIDGSDDREQLTDVAAQQLGKVLQHVDGVVEQIRHDVVQLCSACTRACANTEATRVG